MNGLGAREGEAVNCEGQGCQCPNPENTVRVDVRTGSEISEECWDDDDHIRGGIRRNCVHLGADCLLRLQLNLRGQ